MGAARLSLSPQASVEDSSTFGLLRGVVERMTFTYKVLACTNSTKLSDAIPFQAGPSLH
jgi:hypothetical protein